MSVLLAFFFIFLIPLALHLLSMPFLQLDVYKYLKYTLKTAWKIHALLKIGMENGRLKAYDMGIG
jgi:hypothetical protein